MERSTPLSIQWATAAIYAGVVVLSLVWAGRQIATFGYLSMTPLLVGVILYAALLSFSAVRMRPREDDLRAISALWFLLVLLHAVVGFVALIGFATADPSRSGLRPGWAVSLALGGVFLGVLVSQVMLFAARRARSYCLTNVGMLLYVLGLMIAA
jgi:hypothetical protein